MKRGKRAAFTLMELLVVVAILAMLAALLFPVLARVRAAGHRTACISNLRQLGAAHHLYVQDHDECLPPWSLPGPPRTSGPDMNRYWPIYLKPYLQCDGVMRDPQAPRGIPLLSEYALLTWRQGGRRGDPSEPGQRWPGPPLSLGQVGHPAETIQWMDGRTTTAWTEGVFGRHGRGLNVAFVDGHARWMSPQEFWRVTPDDTGMYWLHYGNAKR